MAIDNITLIFVELALGIFAAVVLGILARLARQPLILAYILAGILISAFGVFRVGDQEVLPLLASFGVIFLLFLVGLELRLSDFRFVGKTAVLTGCTQLILTFVAALPILGFLGFNLTETIYIALALTFSSTIIVVKLLSEKKDLNSLYGKIAIGVLLVQDLAAILSLIALSAFQVGQTTDFSDFAAIFIKGAIVITTAVFLNRFILPTTFKYSAASPELLLITALSWCFVFASFTKLIGFSLEIGAFLAGVAIASSPYHLAILSKVRPMRDFFIVIFFIFLGTNMEITRLPNLILPVILLSLFILVGTPIIVLAVMGFLGQRKRTSFLASISLAQISEFSLILVATGFKLGHISSEIVSLVAAVGITTIAASSYLIIHANSLYQKLAKYLGIFERRQVKESKVITLQVVRDHTVLVGCEQVGKDLLNYLEKRVDKKNIIVVDFNPAAIEALTAQGFNAVYGDIADFELLEELNLGGAKLIISTVPDVQDNLILAKAAISAGFAGPLITTAYWAKDGVKLYEAGADFVLVPELAGGDKVTRILQENWENLVQLKKNKSKYLADLLEKS